MDERSLALLALGRALQDAGYAFVTVSPETHRRVEARAATAGRAFATDLRGIFGWSRPFEPCVLQPHLMALSRTAGVLIDDGPHLRSRVRFSTVHGQLLVHSSYPTTQADAVFLGPDTYRFCDLVARHVPEGARVVDVGCGSGAGGLVACAQAGRVVLADINVSALRFAAINAALAGVEDKIELVQSDVLRDVRGRVDVVLANPPYMRDGAARAYRDGGGAHGEALAVRMASEALARLEPGGTLVLYTGAAIVEGTDTFLAAVGPACSAASAWRYWELDPDVFGDEIESNEAYAAVERIAAVALVAKR